MFNRMDNDLERYEDEYLKRLAGGKSASSKSYEQVKIESHQEHINAIRKTASETKLDSWDYAVLEMIRREDLSGPLKFGTMRTYEAFLKLYCHGLIERLDRKSTFDELERVHAFLDSVAYKQYKERLKRIMTKDVKIQIDTIHEITGVKDVSDLFDVTNHGTEILKAKRAEIIALYDKMSKQYANDRTNFYENTSLYEWALPMMFVMGFTGSVMVSMMASSGAQYAGLGYGFNTYGDMGMMGGNDFDASGFDFGGF